MRVRGADENKGYVAVRVTYRETVPELLSGSTNRALHYWYGNTRIQTTLVSRLLLPKVASSAMAGESDSSGEWGVSTRARGYNNKKKKLNDLLTRHLLLES